MCACVVGPCVVRMSRLLFAPCFHTRYLQKAMPTENERSEHATDAENNTPVFQWEMPLYSDQAGSRAYSHLRAQWLSVALADAHQEVATPADLHPRASVADLLLRDLNGPRGVDMLCAMVRALATNAQGVNLLAFLASEHGARHWQALLDSQAADTAAYLYSDHSAD